MVATYNIRHGTWLRAYYQGDRTLCFSIRNLDGTRIVYPRPHTYSNSTVSRPVSMDQRRPDALSLDVFHTGNVIPPFALAYTPLPSPALSNKNGSPNYRANSFGCPIYYASIASRTSPVSRGDIISPRRAQSPPIIRGKRRIELYLSTGNCIRTLHISVVEMAFCVKPAQVEVVDEVGVCYTVDVRSKPSQPRECYFGTGWRPFCHHHML
ncbi:hypothetical protein HN51_036338 [Arachis hypogaea]